MYGLKGCMKRCAYGSVRYRVKNFWYELVYAWQRAWRGYDFIDLIEMSDALEERIVVLLKDLRTFKHGLWYDNKKQRTVTEEEATLAFDELIDKFERISTDRITKDLYKVSLDQHFWNDLVYKQVSQVQQLRRDEAYKLLSECSYFLCD